jgi:hypothetical protein
LLLLILDILFLLILGILLSIFLEQGFVPGDRLIDFHLPGATSGTLLYGQTAVLKEVRAQLVRAPEERLYSIQNN